MFQVREARLKKKEVSNEIDKNKNKLPGHKRRRTSFVPMLLVGLLVVVEPQAREGGGVVRKQLPSHVSSEGSKTK